MAIIEVRSLTKTYRQKFKRIKALDGMEFSIPEGEICGFLGPNGAGKSTTLKIMMDFIRPNSGEVFINGISAKDIRSKIGVGFMPENPPYIDSLTGRELLLLSAKMHNINSKKAKEKADELLEMLDLVESGDKKLRNYSKGMIQRIGFASTLIIEPKILILDEPMSGLDPIGRYKFKNILKDVHKEGVTILFSSHIISDIEDICDSVIIVNKGKVIKTLNQEQMRTFSIKGYNITLPKDSSVTGYNIEYTKGGLVILKTESDILDKTLSDLAKQGIKPISVEPIKKDLEQVFVDMVESS